MATIIILKFTGIAKYTSELCDYLANEKGHRVKVITGNPYYPKWKLYEGYANSYRREQINQVEVMRLPIYIPKKPSGAKRMFQDFLFLLLGFFKVNGLLIGREKIDYIVIVSPSFSLGLLGLYYKGFSGSTKTINHIQDLQIDAAQALQLIGNKNLLGMMFKIERKILEKMDFVSTISNGMQNKIARKTDPQRPCLLLPNWVDETKVYPIQSALEMPGSLALALHGKKMVLYSGSIGIKQGLETVIEAAEILAPHNEIAFVISGDGPNKIWLERLAEEKKLTNVFFSDLFDSKSFNQVLNLAHIHLIVQKEVDEDLFYPSKLTNILAVGGCLIATVNDKGSLYHLVHNHELGKTVPPSSPYKLSEAIVEILENETKLSSYRSNALVYARSNLEKKRIIDCFLTDIGANAGTTP